jgi:hypothetical protein
MNKILFLDIDGVLNNHKLDLVARSNTIDYCCVVFLNQIIHATQCDIVLSSAWRYMILGKPEDAIKPITKLGFEYLLRTHGVTNEVKIIDVTTWDEFVPTRGEQITHWLKQNKYEGRYVVVDDEKYDIEDKGHPLVQTDGKIGLTLTNAETIINILNRNNI